MSSNQSSASKSSSKASSESASGSSSKGSSSKSSSSSAVGSSSIVASSKSSTSGASASSSKGGSTAASSSKGSTSKSATKSNSRGSSIMASSSKTSSKGGSSTSSSKNSSAKGSSSSTSASSSKGSSRSAAPNATIPNSNQDLVTAACTLNVPTSKADVKDLAKVDGAKKVNSLADIEAANFQIQESIIENGNDEFFHATYKGQKCLCKKTDLKKCSGRYRENLLSTGLRVLRYMGGADGSGKIKSPACIMVLDIFLLDKSVYTFMDHVPGKSLYCRITEKEATTTEMHRKWTIELLQAIQKMQEVGVAHRQLTLHQVLFNKADQVKITGWGKSTIYWDSNNGGSALLQKPERRARNNSYLPPDCFRGPYDPSKVDVWSVGVLMVAMETGRMPFDASSGIKISAQWRQFVTVHPMNRLLRAACNQIFWIDPKRRTNVDKLLKLHYFTSSTEKINKKEVKTTVDPKHQPELFEGADPSVSMSSIGGAPRSSSAVGSSKASRSKSAASVSGSKGSHSKNGSKPSSAASGSKASSVSGASSANSSGSSSSSAGSSAATDEGSDMATGNEGGSVADSASYSKNESQTAINSAPEESAESGKPVSVPSNSFSSATSGSKHSSKTSASSK